MRPFSPFIFPRLWDRQNASGAEATVCYSRP